MIRDFISRYAVRLLGVFLLNVVYVLLTISTFLMIEPFVKLLFRGTLEGLSPVSAFVMERVAAVVPLDNLSRSMVVVIVCAAVLFFLRNLAAYGSQWVMAHVRSDFLYR